MFVCVYHSSNLANADLLQPPITFQPPPPPLPPTSPAISALLPQSQKAPSRPTEADLITRYNLQNKVGKEEGDDIKSGKKGWSSNRDERQTALQRRRDEMILAARKKMEAKIAAEKAAGGST